jgi:hypothetical protein
MEATPMPGKVHRETTGVIPRLISLIIRVDLHLEDFILSYILLNTTGLGKFGKG